MISLSAWPDASGRSSSIRSAKLRPGSTGRTEIRVLFAFDRERMAILLVGGDKSANWSGWYAANIPIADDRFEKHQAALGTTSDATRKRKRR